MEAELMVIGNWESEMQGDLQFFVLLLVVREVDYPARTVSGITTPDFERSVLMKSHSWEILALGTCRDQRQSPLEGKYENTCRNWECVVVRTQTQKQKQGN